MHVCSLCGYRQPDAGTCPNCVEEDLLDSRDPNVLDLLRDMDDRRQQGSDRLATGIAVPLGIILGGVLTYFVPLLSGLLPLPRFVNVVLLMVAVTAGIYFALTKAMRAKPRFPWLDDMTVEAMQAQNQPPPESAF